MLATAVESTSAKIIAGSDDLLAEILVRSPVSSLIRFKCVSKRWCSLISGHHFSLLHTFRHRRSKPSGLLFRHKPSLHPDATTAPESDFELVQLNGGVSTAPSLRYFSFIPGQSSVSGTIILQSCNGLLLCCSFPFMAGTRRRYYVVNPTTQQYIELDPPLEDGTSAIFLGVNLAFDPSKSPHYKVVCVQITLRSLYNYRIWIYSSKTRSWRISLESFAAPFDMVFTEGVFWNGAIHWINPYGASLCLDVDRECFRKMPEIPFHQSNLAGKSCRFFGESNGHLHLVEVEGPQTTQFQVFEMKVDYSQWFAKYRVDIGGVVAAFPEMIHSYLDSGDGNYYDFSILGVHHEDDEDESLLVLNIPGKIITYNFKNGNSKELVDFAPAGKDKRLMPQLGCFDIYQYSETLAPV
ncbi:F-box protein At5g07610-like [Diospyros lotus]|uniref:F-box protein At5g07610-like n=1 Tax=Diospyros lotus TaxID=55363 RepID=UPI002253D880|nr:F-box protein At5g07610-like [Diospyros lotus]